MGKTSATGRIDIFGVTEKTTRTLDNNDEHGWSVDAALRQDLGHNTNLVLEALYINSIRPSRADISQGQLVVQTAIRWRF